MDSRTRDYLEGRFGDHYRRAASDGSATTAGPVGEGIDADLAPPPAAETREWGYIPYSAGGTRMVRHRSLMELTGGSALESFLARSRPRHVYFSAGRYRRPGADSMGAKHWQGADLIFDIDADHLPGIDETQDSYAEMLGAAKQALLSLVDILRADFGFEEITLVFSGGRGYHAHVRDAGVLALTRAQRREIVDYVRGIGVEFDQLVDSEVVAGLGRKTPAAKRTLSTAGGWSGRLHAELMELVRAVESMDEAAALGRLREFDGVGQGKAKAALRAITENRAAIEQGNIDVHTAVYSVSKHLFETVRASEGAPIDEPVTTDLNRLIRLPGSLHGGTGLVVSRLAQEGLEDFDPLTDAIAPTFRGQAITVDVTESVTASLGGEKFNLEPGEHELPEHVGVFLMARGAAAKARE